MQGIAVGTKLSNSIIYALVNKSKRFIVNLTVVNKINKNFCKGFMDQPGY